MMKKVICLLISLALIAAMGILCVSADETTEEWSSVISDKYTVDENGNVISVAHYGQLGPEHDGVINTMLYQGFETGDGITSNYRVSVKMTGTKTLPVDNHIREGIIPWYVDKDNYLVVYVEWADWDRPSEMRCVQVTGRIGGKNICVFDSFAFDYLPGNGWNDFWTDGYTYAPTETFELVVEMYENDDFVEVIFILNDADGNTLKDGSVWVEKSEELQKSGKVGLYAFNDTVTFSDFSIEVIEDEPEETQPQETEPQQTEPQQTEPQDDPDDTPDPTDPVGDTPDDGGNAGLIIGIVVAVVVVAAVVVVIVKKKK